MLSALTGLGFIFALFVTSKLLKDFLLCRSTNLIMFHNKNGGMVERDLRSDFMLSKACYFKCQSLGGGSHANNFLQRLHTMKVGEHTPNL